jgi:acyl carrier protein
MNVEAELQTLIKKQAGGRTETIATDAKLADLGLDSIDLVEIAFDIEDKFHVRLTQNSEEISNATFGDLVKLVERSIAEKSAAPAPGTAA